MSRVGRYILATCSVTRSMQGQVTDIRDHGAIRSVELVDNGMWSGESESPTLSGRDLVSVARPRQALTVLYLLPPRRCDMSVRLWSVEGTIEVIRQLPRLYLGWK